MNFDFLLTTTGDITFEKINRQDTGNYFEYNFHVAPSDSLMINFYTESNPLPLMKNYFTYNFYITFLNKDKTARSVIDNEYLQQAIRLRLDTERNTILNNKELGCYLAEVMHDNVSDAKLLSNISKIVKEAISDLVPDAEIEASFVNKGYLDYYDTVKLSIKINNQIFYYTL